MGEAIKKGDRDSRNKGVGNRDSARMLQGAWVWEWGRDSERYLF